MLRGSTCDGPVHSLRQLQAHISPSWTHLGTRVLCGGSSQIRTTLDQRCRSRLPQCRRNAFEACEGWRRPYRCSPLFVSFRGYRRCCSSNHFSCHARGTKPKWTHEMVEPSRELVSV